MSKNLTAHITVGIPCSGKSTWAKEFCRKAKAINTNRDDIRFSITGARGWSEYKFTRSVESMVTQIQRDIIKKAFEAGKDVVISDTNLNEAYRTAMIAFCKDVGYAVKIEEFPISLEEAWKRDAARENGVGAQVIYTMHQKWLEYVGYRKYVPAENGKNCVICDVDGTVAQMEGRSAYDWNMVGTDKPREQIIKMVKSQIDDGVELIFLSGRDGVCYEETHSWLEEHFRHHPFRLLMRPVGDMRKDVVVKRELFMEHINGKYDVLAAFDDRPCVVRLWLDMGLPNVTIVANPYIEF